MKKIVEDDKCYGCAACKAVCPQKCITLCMNKLGFWQPEIDDKICIDCGICQQICISRNYVSQKKAADIYVGVHRDEQIHMQSSSGGAFTAIVSALFNDNAVIYGAAYDEHMQVVHQKAETIEKIKKFRKSKYVQSKTDGVYDEIRRDLRQGKRVIFSGTPCQVSGLYAALGNSNVEELFTIDLVCTGVSSPGLFRKYLDYISQKYKEEVTSVDMRYKVRQKEGWNIGDTEVVLGGKKRIRNKYTHLYRSLYGQKISYRKSCYRCQYASIDRVGDFTIGDWWGELDKLPEVKEHNGVSVIIFNTEKAKQYEDIMKNEMYLAPKSEEDIRKDNPTFQQSTLENARCEKFRRDYERMQSRRLLKKYARPEMKVYVLWIFSRVIPKRWRSHLKSILYHGND